MAAYTREPSAVTASARGVSPAKVRMASGVPPSVVPRLVASKTQTSARGTPAVVSCGSPAPGTAAISVAVRCCPRCAVVMNARSWLVPAKTMSLGSSPTRSVRVTRGGVDPTSTMLMLSET